jgi:hypothetical protein
MQNVPEHIHIHTHEVGYRIANMSHIIFLVMYTNLLKRKDCYENLKHLHSSRKCFNLVRM